LEIVALLGCFGKQSFCGNPLDNTPMGVDVGVFISSHLAPNSPYAG
jgi:hypothetical protein